jgi:hypothetical protein
MLRRFLNNMESKFPGFILFSMVVFIFSVNIFCSMRIFYIPYAPIGSYKRIRL